MHHRTVHIRRRGIGQCDVHGILAGTGIVERCSAARVFPVDRQRIQVVHLIRKRFNKRQAGSGLWERLLSVTNRLQHLKITAKFNNRLFFGEC